MSTTRCVPATGTDLFTTGTDPVTTRTSRILGRAPRTLRVPLGRPAALARPVRVPFALTRAALTPFALAMLAATLLAPALAACVQAGTPTPAGETGAVAAAPTVAADDTPTIVFATIPAILPDASGCPIPPEGTQLFRDDARGYCLLYPEGYIAQTDASGATEIFEASPLSTPRPRVTIAVTTASASTPGDAADVLLDAATGSARAPTSRRGTIYLDGAEAVVVDPVPGAIVSRLVVAIHDGRQYVLSFTPADPAGGDAYDQMEVLYGTVLELFRFQTVTPAP
jgi:hypothetical protein